ncbi:MAG: hypothetical protein KF743_00475 [Fimbriimonadaceae bacterium]|nr:hypothetical protein [Fimbriimonadaceae bacterium]
MTARAETAMIFRSKGRGEFICRVLSKPNRVLIALGAHCVQGRIKGSSVKKKVMCYYDEEPWFFVGEFFPDKSGYAEIEIYLLLYNNGHMVYRTPEMKACICSTESAKEYFVRQELGVLGIGPVEFLVQLECKEFEIMNDNLQRPNLTT